MNAILFGGTGMVGIEVLHHCLADPRIERLVSVVRRTTDTQHPKLREVVHDDFLDYRPLEPELARADLGIFCIGVYQGTVPDDVFWRITYDYAANLIETIERVRPELTFCLFSASGADPSERSPLLFARAKGRAEKRLTDSRIKRHYIFRPGYIHPGRQRPASQRSTWFMPPLYRLAPVIGIDAADLAAVMVEVGLNGHDHVLLGNAEMRKLAQQYRSACAVDAAAP